MLIDSHAHLDDERFDEDRDELIKSFTEKGIDYVVNIGADMESSIKSVELANEYENIYAAVGIHPHSAKEMDDSSLDKLRDLSKNKKVVAIGEIGLDYYYDNSPRDIQRKRFAEQLELAKELDLPVVIHSRDATQETYDMIADAQDGSLRGVIHCFSGSVEIAREYIDKLGFYISLGGPVTFKKSVTPKEVAKEIELEKILIETDSPYLTPEPFRGRRNDPTKVLHVAEEIAEIKGISLEELGEITSKNVRDLFGF